MLRHSREQNYYNEQLKQMRINESKQAIQSKASNFLRKSLIPLLHQSNLLDHDYISSEKQIDKK